MKNRAALLNRVRCVSTLRFENESHGINNEFLELRFQENNGVKYLADAQIVNDVNCKHMLGGGEGGGGSFGRANTFKHALMPYLILIFSLYT